MFTYIPLDNFDFTDINLSLSLLLLNVTENAQSVPIRCLPTLMQYVISNLFASVITLSLSGNLSCIAEDMTSYTCCCVLL